MNTRLISFSAVGLWLVTALVGGLYLFRDRTRESSDHRREILLAETERNLVLAEMRGIIGSLDGVLQGLTKSDRKQIEKSARASGMVMASEENAGLIAKLPMEFKQMGLGLHREFDSLADAVKAGTRSLHSAHTELSERNGTHPVSPAGGKARITFQQDDPDSLAQAIIDKSKGDVEFVRQVWVELQEWDEHQAKTQEPLS